MSAAALSPLASSVEKTNGAKLSRLLIDGGTTVLRNVFDRYHPPANLAADLNANYLTLNNLLRKRVLRTAQWDQLFPPGGAAPDSNTFDITLLFLLLTNICGLAPPLSGWHTKPPPSDTSREANLARVKFFRNELYGHVSTTGVDTPNFTSLWQEISAVLVALGLNQAEIDRLKAEHCGEEDYLDVLRDWADSEEDIKSQLKDIRQDQTETQRQVENVRQTQLEDRKTIQESNSKLEEVKQAIECLKEEKGKDREEEVLQKLVKSEFKGDIEYHVGRFQEGTREWVFNKVQNWLDDRTSQNRVMVITANAGMGKTVISAVICKRLQEAGRLSGSHFCQHNNARYRNPQLMLQSLACHLCHALPEYKQALVEQLSRNLGKDLNNMGVEELFALLFKEPLSTVADPGRNMLMVIDGLDESEYQERNELLDVIVKHFCKLPPWIRFLCTTRPERNIAKALKQLKPFELEPNEEGNVQDIRWLFEERMQHLMKPESKGAIVEKLVEKAEGLMLYAYFLISFIEENVSVLDQEDLDASLPLNISSVYESYFQRLENELIMELGVKEDNFLKLLCAVTASREPLPIDFVSKVFVPSGNSSVARRKLLKVIGSVSSLLPIRDGCLHVIHKSVKDWLTDTTCYGEHDFTVDEKEGHRILASLCSDELDNLKQKGVPDNTQFSSTEKYALHHGARHMLQLDENMRSRSLDEFVQTYVTDLELVFAKLCIDDSIAAEDILWLRRQKVFQVLSEDRKDLLKTLMFLLRKYYSTYTKYPRLFFQTVLNEGGTLLSAEASKLLQEKYPEIPYLEYVLKDVHEDAPQATFSCSSQVVCFDVSPQLDYMVCECRDKTIQLWSLRTGKPEWVRPAMVKKLYSHESKTYRTSPSSPVFSCYRSVVFHPTKEVVLPGLLSSAYAIIDGELKPLFPESGCSFTVCSVVNSGEETAIILTDCPDDAKCIIIWSLENGSEISRITRGEDVLSFACSRDGKLLAISHCSGSICLLDVTEGFRTLAHATTSKVCGMIKFSADNQFLFCWHEPLSQQEHFVFQLEVTRRNDGAFSLDVLGDKVSYKPLEYESRTEAGFLSGDRFSCVFEKAESGYSILVEGAFMFVLGEQCVLRTFPGNSSIAMFTPTELRSHTASFHHRQKFIADNIAFSRNGEIVYVVATEPTVQRVVFVGQEVIDLTERFVTIMACNVSSGELMAEKRIQSGESKRLVPVKEGVLFTTGSDCPELWNFKLSECIRTWPYVREITEMMPISENQVACVGKRNEVTILDTTSTDIVKTIPFSRECYASTSQILGREAITCNSRCQLLYQLVSTNLDCQSLQLSDGTDILWENHWPHSLRCSYFLPVGFSPSEEFVVISALTSKGDQSAYLLDAQSGETCRTLCRGTDFYDCKFVTDEECIIDYQDASGEFLFQMFNIKSGDLLGAIVRQFRTFCLATCPLKRLVAIDVVANDDSKRIFQIVQVNLPRDKKQKEQMEDQETRRLKAVEKKRTRELGYLDVKQSEEAEYFSPQPTDKIPEVRDAKLEKTHQAATLESMPTSVVLGEDTIKTLTKKFEAEHQECVRVLPYKDKDGHLEVHLYIYPGKSGLQKDLEAAAQDCFGEMAVPLKWLDLYNKASRVLNITSVHYPSGKPNRLEAGKVNEISEVIRKNRNNFSKHRNITAVQPSFKVKESTQTTDPCIAVYVVGKGHIPLGESEIPPIVDGCLVDIMDGFWFEAVEPWEPTEAQQEFEVLPLGASIGVEGVEACGTLGAIVEDENNPGILYALSCDHVLNSGTEQRKIVQPGLNDYQNNIRWMLKDFRGRSNYIPGPNCLDNESIHDLQEKATLLAKLKKQSCINKRIMDLLEDDQTDPYATDIPDDKIKAFHSYFKDGDEARRTKVANLQRRVSALPDLEKKIEQSLEKKPRNVAKYTTGIRGNKSAGDKDYFIDAVIAELSQDEVAKLQNSLTTEIIGTHYYPNGDCTPSTTEAIIKAGKLCKSGRTTGYTESRNLVRYTSEAPTYLQSKSFRLKGELSDVEMKYHFCQACAPEKHDLSNDEKKHVCKTCGKGEASLYKTKWLENVLCIASEQEMFARSGDSGSVIFEIEENGDKQRNDCLTGFGLLFGVLETAHKFCALASPLGIALKELSGKVSESCKLRLVSNYYE
ncbi:uncharacterized protein LOC144666197 isoform X2 [Oculina patagonica]